MVKGLRLHGGLCAAPGMTLPPGVCLPSFTAALSPRSCTPTLGCGAVGFIHPRLRVESWSHVEVAQPRNTGFCVAEASIVSSVGFGTDKPARGSRRPDAAHPPGQEASLGQPGEGCRAESGPTALWRPGLAGRPPSRHRARCLSSVMSWSPRH